MVTLVARVTYVLRSVRCEVSTAVEPVRTADVWVEGDRGGAYVREPSDVAPMKERADVVVVGKAYAPGEAAATEVAARIVVGEVDKALRITGPRRFGRDGAPLAPAPFRDAAMDWTRAGGGEDTSNPVGIDDRAAPDARGEVPAPTVLSFGVELGARDAYVAPAGFGPLAPTWPTRRDAAPPGAAAWVDAPSSAQLDWNESARPGFFQCAPGDQRLARPLRADERIVLEGLHPRHPRLVTNLPGVALNAVAVDAASGRVPLQLQADTLWIDTERQLVTVTHRVAVPARVLEGTDVFVWLEGFDALVAQDMADAGGETADAGASAHPATPFGRPSANGPVRHGDDEEFERAAMGTMAAPEVLPRAAPVPFTGAAKTRPVTPAQVRAATPFAQAAAPLAPPLAPPAPPMAPPAPPMAPQVAMAPSGPAVAPSAARPPAWSPSAAAPIAPPLVEKIDTWKLHEQAQARRTGDEPAAEPPPRPDAPPAATSSAAAAAPVVTRPRAVEVVWYDSTTEVELAGRSRTLLDQLGEGDGDEWMTPAEVAGGSLERARRDIAHWLRTAPPMDAERLHDAMTRALERDDAERPFAVIAGDLVWTFDPRESLRAWIALGTPMVADPRVKEAIESAERAMAEHLVTIPDVLNAALDRLRDVVRSIAKTIGPTPIDAAAERYLVEERGFAKRRVWGQNRLRAHLHARGARAPIPVYLPDAAGWESPLSQRFAARLVGEIRSRQDPTEGARVCLRAVALGIEIV